MSSKFSRIYFDKYKQLIRLDHKDIYVLTNGKLFSYFQEYKDTIKLIDVNLLEDTYKFLQRCNIDFNFRGGFWTLTSMRFFYIYQFMIQYQITDVIHLENDVLVYYNCYKLITKVDKNYLYMPFDSFNRNVASIMYIPNASVFKIILDRYSPHETDMKNFVRIRSETERIKLFPIFCNEDSSESEVAFVSNNFNQFEYIFDGAAIGQYLGGIDPRNNPNFYSVGVLPINNEDFHIGFVSSDDCVIKYNNYVFFWKELDGIKKPNIIVDNKEIPIFNLHIHSKKLYKYI